MYCQNMQIRAAIVEKSKNVNILKTIYHRTIILVSRPMFSWSGSMKKVVISLSSHHVLPKYAYKGSHCWKMKYWIRISNTFWENMIKMIAEANKVQFVLLILCVHVFISWPWYENWMGICKHLMLPVTVWNFNSDSPDLT